MSACCNQCLQFALRAEFAGSDVHDTDGRPFQPLTTEEGQRWGVGHFTCPTPSREELRSCIEQDLGVGYRDSRWVWVK